MNKYAFFKVSDDYLFERMKEYDCEVLDVYKKIPKLLKAVRKLHYLLKLPFFNIWLTRITSEITNYDLCIVSASNYSARFVQSFTKRSNARIIFWYNNPISYHGRLHDSIAGNEKVVVSSFDRLDCDKYGLFYNTQYYFRNIQLPQCEIEYDVLFIGKDKGRLKTLQKLEEYFNHIGLKTCFYICESDADGNGSKTNHIYKPYLSYDQVLDYIAKARIILDINQSIQYGLTLRPLESIFFEKKLITNNKGIFTERFYNPNNISVIDIEHPKISMDFFEKPYERMEENIVHYYDFESWLHRFEQTEQSISEEGKPSVERVIS